MSSTNVFLPDTTGLTFEKVWAMFQETGKKMQETNRLTNRLLKENAKQQKETDRKFQETEKMLRELTRSQKRTDKQIGDLGNRFGEVAEHLVAPGIVRRFNKLGYHFNVRFSNSTTIFDDEGQVLTEIDIVLENTETVALVEVKSKPVQNDIEHHFKRIRIFRQYLEKNTKVKKVIIGAIAGAVFPEDVKEEVIKAGLYVITQSGDTIKIDVPKGFKPKEF